MKLVLILYLIVLTLYTVSPSGAESPEEIQCGANATLEDSGYNCQTCKLLTVKCAKVNEKGCYCKPGYVKRDEFDLDCIGYDDCPPQDLSSDICCGENEVIKDEGIDCATCSNYQFVRCALIKERRCYCKDGYVRRDDDNKCTLTSECPK